jgi:hypothetical protein
LQEFDSDEDASSLLLAGEGDIDTGRLNAILDNFH